MRVRDIMTKAVLIIPQETSAEDAARIMRETGLACSPLAARTTSPASLPIVTLSFE